MQRGEKRKRNRDKEESRVKENIVEEGKKRGKQSLCEKGCTTCERENPIKGGGSKRSPTANRTVCPGWQRVKWWEYVQTCSVIPVQSATEWTAGVHTLHMSKPVM